MVTQFAVRPQQYSYGVTPTQGFDFSSIINMMIPLMGMMMMMGMMMPMMRNMTKGFGD